VTLYVSPLGLTTGSIPYVDGLFQLDLDFINHKLHVVNSQGYKGELSLYGRPIADFYAELFNLLRNAGIEVSIYDRPNELDKAVPFPEDNEPREYDPAKMNLFWQALSRIEVVFTRFRSGFTGKVSPVHFFWGSFDLAVTRFSGRSAPLHPGGTPNMPDKIMQEAYSHEVSSCGFWPGSDAFPTPVFYSYCYPVPTDFGKHPVKPEEAFFSEEMGEFFLPYQVVQQSENPEEMLLKFLRTTYLAAAVAGKWDPTLECNLTYLEKEK